MTKERMEGHSIVSPQIFDHSGPKFWHNGNASPLKNDVFQHQKSLFRSAFWLTSRQAIWAQFEPKQSIK